MGENYFKLLPDHLYYGENISNCYPSTFKDISKADLFRLNENYHTQQFTVTTGVLPST